MAALRFTHLAPQKEDGILLQNALGDLYVKAVLFTESSEDYSDCIRHRRLLKIIKYLSAVLTYPNLLALSSYFISEKRWFTVLPVKLKLIQALM